MLDRRLYSIIVESLGPEFVEQYPNDFEKRVIVQKVLFLLTHINDISKISLPYDWTFYLRGPYSSEIAHMLYYFEDFLTDLKKQPLILEEKDRQAIQQFKEFAHSFNFELNKRIGLETISEKIMECLATLVYISEQVGGDNKKISTIFKRLKPDLAKLFKEDLVEISIKSLKQFHFI